MGECFRGSPLNQLIVPHTLLRTQLSTVVDEANLENAETGTAESTVAETPITDSDVSSRRPLLLSVNRGKLKPLDCLRVNRFHFFFLLVLCNLNDPSSCCSIIFQKHLIPQIIAV